LLSLLWRPELPAGWTALTVSGDGNPELVAGEIVWVGARLPLSPVTMVYSVQVPPDEGVPREIRSKVEYQLGGTVNPATRYADPDALAVVALRIAGFALLGDADSKLTVEAICPDRLRSSLARFRALDHPADLSRAWGGFTSSPTRRAAAQRQRFYRAVKETATSPPQPEGNKSLAQSSAMT